MSDAQYRALLNLYHEYNEAFLTLSPVILNLFYERLYYERAGLPRPM